MKNSFIFSTIFLLTEQVEIEVYRIGNELFMKSNSSTSNLYINIIKYCIGVEALDVELLLKMKEF